MKYWIYIITLVFGLSNLNAQEFECQVKVDAVQTGKLQLSIFDNLEQSLTEFVNQNSWTNNRNLKDHQKIKCSMFVNITSYEDNFFEASIQFQSSRPVFGSDISTPILNINDRSFNFNYTEFQPLNFNPNTFETNLISVVSFYLLTSLGMDADSFEKFGGTEYYQQAQQVASAGQSANASGWSSSGGSGDFNRFNLIRDLISQNFSQFREALYVYHREGLDQMHEDVELGKENIIRALDLLKENNQVRPNSLLVRSFFDAKANEVQLILNGGPEADVAAIKESLYKMAPGQNRVWKEIK